MISLSFTWTHRSFSAALLSSRPAPSLYWCLGLLLPTYSTLHFPLLNIIKFLSAQLSNQSRSCWLAVQPLDAFSKFPQFLITNKLAEGTFYPFIQIVDKQDTRIRLNPVLIPLECHIVQASNLILLHWSKSSELCPSASSWSTPLYIHLTHIS